VPKEDGLKWMRTIFAVLADEQRLRILLALTAAESLCVGEVAVVLRTSAPVASHHLRRMRDLGVLQDRGAGKLRYYRVRQKAVARLAAAALALWEQS
jgi:DNA-binding transcriptional ArsR family regulator